jgi:hypothetical protein
VAFPPLTNAACVRQLDCNTTVMELSKTIAELYQEKAKLDRVIASLEQLGVDSLPVSITTSRRGRKFMSPQERHQVSERMRRYWADRKAAKQREPVRVMTAASAA